MGKVVRIKTAEDFVRDHDRRVKQRAKDLRDFKAHQKKMEDIQDLRDDVMALIRNARVDYEDIHAKFGPTPTTLNRWDKKEIKAPRIGKMRSALRAIGKDFYIGDYKPRTKS